MEAVKKEEEFEPEIRPVDEIPRARFSEVFKNRGFLFLWSGQLFSQLADRIFVYVLMIMAYNLTKTNLGVAVPMLSFGIPSVLFASFAGVFVDRFNKRFILFSSDILRGFLILLAIPMVERSLLGTFLISFLIYTITQFFSPAEASSIPELVEKRNLIVANSLFMATWMISSVLGIGLGAPLVTFFGEHLTLTIAASLYFISAVFVFFVKLKFEPKLTKNIWKSFWTDLLVGIEFIRRNVLVKYSLLKMFVATGALAVVCLLALTFAKEVLGIGERNFGYLIIAAGVGMFIGTGTLSKLNQYVKKGTIVITSFILSSVAILFLIRVLDIRHALILAMFLGLFNIYIVSTLQTILQSNIPKSMRGRVFGIQNMLINSGFTFPLIIFGAIADFWGLSIGFIVLSIILLATGIAGIFIPKFRTV